MSTLLPQNFTIDIGEVGVAALILGIVVLLVFLGLVFLKFIPDHWAARRADDGIRVGQPKVYDSRSLSLMLEQLQNQLNALHGIDSSIVTGAFGTQQAERRSIFDSSGNLALGQASTASNPPTNDSGTNAKGNAGNGDSSAAGKADPDAKNAAPGASLKWSERAADLLSDQINLQYQMFNLRLLLERAISDRASEITGQARVQAVIGFPVSIDPPWFTIGCAGTVEVELTLAGPNKLPAGDHPRPAPSLIALFPQEETYNTWSVDRRRFNLGVAGTSANVTGSGSGSSEVGRTAIRRQADIVAYEREETAVYGDWNPKPEAACPLVVAWQFRPGIGERRVSAGLRQMLAVVSLPRCDEHDTVVAMDMRVRSFWERWDGRSQLGWRALLSKRPIEHAFPRQAQTFNVCTTAKLDKLLAPRIDCVEWFRVGSQEAVVIVTGRNFFTGTAVTMGDTHLTAENAGITIKSQKTLEIDAPLSALLYDVVLNGRYGRSIELQDKTRVKVQTLRIRKAWIDPKPGDQTYMVRIEFTASDNSVLDWHDFVRLPDPILAINGKVVPNLLLFSRANATGRSIIARVSVTSEFIPDSPVLLVRWPFFGEDWLLNYQISYSKVNVSAVSSESASQKTTIFLSGRVFAKDVRVIADESYEIDNEKGPLFLLAPDLLRIELSSAVVESNPVLFICETDAPTIQVRIPPAKRIPLPELDLSSKPPVITSGEDTVVDFQGTGLDTVTKVLFENDPVEFVVYGDGRSISVFVGDELIKSSGRKTINFHVDAGETLTADVFVVPAKPNTSSEIRTDLKKTSTTSHDNHSESSQT
jgi:hypothetical protein